MDRNETPAKKADVPQIRIEVPVNDETRVFLEPAPEGVPPELFPHLADFWKRGFTAATSRQGNSHFEGGVDLSGFTRESRGRPIDDESEREGREAAKLRKKGRLSFGQIARQVCRYRKERRHRCKKQCTDRIRQAMLQYQSREEVQKLARGDLDS